MKIKINLTLLFFGLMNVNLFAAGNPPAPLTVAVYDFADADKDVAGYGAKVSALVTADLTTETNLIMVERADLIKALGEQAIGISGMVSSDQAAKIGQLTGAKVLVSGLAIETGKGRLVVVANIVGTETGRLFAEKMEGATENFTDLTSKLSRKIAQTIREQASNFVNETQSHEERIDRILKNIVGTNRPTVSVNIYWWRGPKDPCIAANTEMGIILQKAGFVVVDGQAERKPDVEISGLIENDDGPQRGNLFSTHAVVDIKVQERQTGKIIIFDHQTADAVDIGQNASRKSAAAKAVDSLAERVLPMVAIQPQSKVKL